MGIIRFISLGLVIFVATYTQAQTPLPVSFNEHDVVICEHLVALATQNDPEVLNAELALQQSELNESVAGLLSESVTLSVGTGLNSPTFEQVNPTFNVAVGVDLMALLQPRVSRVEADRLSVEAQKKTTRVNVLRAYMGYRVALAAAQSAGTSLENRVRQLEVTQVQVQAGAVAPTDVLSAQDALFAAQLGLYEANANLMVTKTELAQVVGITPEELEAVLTSDALVANP